MSSYIALQRELDVKAARMPFFKQVLHNFIRGYVPRKFKRLVLLASIVGLMEHGNYPDRSLTARLNRILKIAHNDDALAFPMYIHSWIWEQCIANTPCVIAGKPVGINEIDLSGLDGQDQESLATYFARRTPDFLQYGSERLIQRDLLLLFQNLQVLFQR